MTFQTVASFTIVIDTLAMVKARASETLIVQASLTIVKKYFYSTGYWLGLLLFQMEKNVTAVHYRCKNFTG